MRIAKIFTIVLGVLLTPATFAAPVAGESLAEGKNGAGTEKAGLPGFENFLECSNFTWMQNCRKINEWISSNPDQPLRLKKDGVEFYFPPGTPSPTIDWVVNQTPESLERYLSYLEKLSARNRKSAAMYNAALESRGGKLRGDVALDYFLMPPQDNTRIKFNENNVSIFIFVDSKCTACAIFEPRIAQLREEYKNLSISILQVDNDRSAARELEANTGVRVTVLTPSQFTEYRKNVRVFPTVWIQDRRNRTTSVIEGVVTYPELARQIAKVAK